jgi:hypothetical protein
VGNLAPGPYVTVGPRLAVLFFTRIPRLTRSDELVAAGKEPELGDPCVELLAATVSAVHRRPGTGTPRVVAEVHSGYWAHASAPGVNPLHRADARPRGGGPQRQVQAVGNPGVPCGVGMSPVQNADKTSVRWIMSAYDWPVPIDPAILAKVPRSGAHVAAGQVATRREDEPSPARRADRAARPDRCGPDLPVDPEAWFAAYGQTRIPTAYVA